MKKITYYFMLTLIVFLSMIIQSNAQCDSLKITDGKYSETDNLIGAVQSEFGKDSTIADWSDLKAISNIGSWINCMNLENNQVFMVTKNGNYFYGTNRQYYVKYFASGQAPSGWLVHDKIDNKLFLGSWYGLNMPILSKVNDQKDGKLEIYFNPSKVSPTYEEDQDMWYWYFDLRLKNSGDETIEVMAISAFNEFLCKDYGKQYCAHSDYGYYTNFREWFGSCYVNGKLLIEPGQSCTSSWWIRYDDASFEREGNYFVWYMNENGGEEKLATSQDLILLKNDVETCDQPGWISVPTSSTGDHTVSWGESSTSSVTYVLEEATNSSFTSNRRIAYSGTGKVANITGRSSGSTYYYRVKATKNGYEDSAWKVGNNGCGVIIKNNNPDPDPKYTGSIRVIIEPYEAVRDGAKWSIREHSPNHKLESGTTVLNIPTGRFISKTYTLHFEGAEGWAPPLDFRVEVKNKIKMTYKATYRRDPIGKDPILSHEACVGISTDFYILDLEISDEILDVDIPQSKIDSIFHQGANILKGFIKDNLSIDSFIIKILTGAGTLHQTLIRTCQWGGTFVQSELVMLNKDGEVFRKKETVNSGETFLPIIWLKTNRDGEAIGVKIQTSHPSHKLPFTLETDSTMEGLKGKHIYLLIPRTTSLTEEGNGWNFSSKARGMNGFTINTKGEYKIELATFLTSPGFGLKKYDVTVGPSTMPDIKINNSDGPLKLKEGKPVSVQIGLQTSEELEADWWILAQTPTDWFYLSFDCKNIMCWKLFDGILEPTHQGPVGELELVELQKFEDGLPAGDYVFYFGVDTKMNGVIDNKYLYLDYVNVKVVD